MDTPKPKTLAWFAEHNALQTQALATIATGLIPHYFKPGEYVDSNWYEQVAADAMGIYEQILIKQYIEYGINWIDQTMPEAYPDHTGKIKFIFTDSSVAKYLAEYYGGEVVPDSEPGRYKLCLDPLEKNNKPLPFQTEEYKQLFKNLVEELKHEAKELEKDAEEVLATIFRQ